MGVYVQDIPTFATASPMELKECPIYGTSRIGVFKKAFIKGKPDGTSLYELTDNLGNVRPVITKSSFGVAALVGKTDFYPFGMVMPDRDVASTYRYAFQGQEKDKETGLDAFELRLWDGRLGRWLTVDPAGQYFSPYLGMGNNPSHVDPTGGSDFPERNGYECGETWSDADGSWMWDSDNKTWVTQDGVSGDVLTQVNIGNGTSGAMISQWDPSFTERWHSSGNFFAQMSYSIANGAGIMAQYLMGRSVNDLSMRSLDGSSMTPDETLMDWVSFSTLFTGEGALANGEENLLKPRGEKIGNIKVTIYRVYGEGASMFGKSYSIINPKYVPFYRNFAELPKVNSGEYLLKGQVPLKNMKIGQLFASPLDGNTGGLPLELYQRFDQLINPASVIIKKPF